MDSPSPPPVPDPYATADAQGKANLEAARTGTALNRADQITPYGRLLWHNSATPADTMDTLYQQMLGRDSDPEGRAFYNQQHSGGMSWDDIKAEMARSDEYKGRVTAGTANADGTGTTGWTPGAASQDHWWSEIQLDPRVQALMDSGLKQSQNLTDTTDAALSRVNATLSHDIDYSALPAAGNWQQALGDASGQFTDFRPQTQGALGLASQGQSWAQSALGKWGQQSAAPIDPNNAATRQKVEDALYQQAQSRLDPQYAQQSEALINDMKNRGIPEGSEAWKSALDQLGRTKTDAYNQANFSSIAAGGAEESRQQQMQLAARDQGLQELEAALSGNHSLSGDANGWLQSEQAQNAAKQAYAGNTFNMENFSRSQALTEQEQQRARILNELQALRTGQQVSMPQFGQTPSGVNLQPAPIAQSIWNAFQGQMGQYNTDVGSSNSMMGAGIGGIATIAAAFI